MQVKVLFPLDGGIRSIYSYHVGIGESLVAALFDTLDECKIIARSYVHTVQYKLYVSDPTITLKGCVILKNLKHLICDCSLYPTLSSLKHHWNTYRYYLKSKKDKQECLINLSLWKDMLLLCVLNTCRQQCPMQFLTVFQLHIKFLCPDLEICPKYTDTHLSPGTTAAVWNVEYNLGWCNSWTTRRVRQASVPHRVTLWLEVASLYNCTHVGWEAKEG